MEGASMEAEESGGRETTVAGTKGQQELHFENRANRICCWLWAIIPDDTTLIRESEELKSFFFFFLQKSFLMRVKEESEKAGLKFNTQKN